MTKRKTKTERTAELVRRDRELWTDYATSSRYGPFLFTRVSHVSNFCFLLIAFYVSRGLSPQRYPGQVILKSTRLRVSHTRRRDCGRIMDADVSERDDTVDSVCVQMQNQPLCLSTSVQTEPSSTLTTQPVIARMTSLPPLPVPSPADSSCSPCSLSSLLGSPISPPPPPPPPPPLPPKEELSPTGSPARLVQKAEGKSAAEELSLSPLGPFIPRFFDSSQLESARKRLRKTPEFSSHSRRGTGVIWYCRLY